MEKKIKAALMFEAERPEKTSNGFEIYYDEETGEAVGIVYEGIVHLKRTSPVVMNWWDAVNYCKTVVINGIRSELCPVNDTWLEEFESIHKALYQAFDEIGAENLNYASWCAEFSISHAWYQSFGNGTISNGYAKNYNYYVRPVLILKRKV